jgi:membrane protease YdiL (CAAX protease family)
MGFRLILAIASLMRSLGAQLAMFSLATLANFYTIPLWASVSLPRGIGNSLVAAVPEFFVFLLVTVLLLRLLHQGSISEIGLSMELASVREFLMFSALGAVAVSLVVLPMVAVGLGSFRNSEPRIQDWSTILLCTGLLLLAAFAEEVLARGYAFQTLIQPLHLLGALIVTNGVFAALHLNNRNSNEFSVTNTFLAGCVFGMLLVVRRNLWAPAGAHFGWNIATPLLGVNLSGLPLQFTSYSIEWRGAAMWTGGGYGPEASLVCTIVLLALLLFLFRLHFQKSHENSAVVTN